MSWQPPQRWDKGVVFNEYRVSVVEDEKHSGGGLHTRVHVVNTTELYTYKWLGW